MLASNLRRAERSPVLGHALAIIGYIVLLVLMFEYPGMPGRGALLLGLASIASVFSWSTWYIGRELRLPEGPNGRFFAVVFGAGVACWAPMWWIWNASPWTEELSYAVHQVGDADLFYQRLTLAQSIDSGYAPIPWESMPPEPPDSAGKKF